MKPRSSQSPLRRATWAALGGALSLAIGVPDALALTPEEEARAEALFDEGRALMVEPGKLNEGCAKLEESLRLYDRGDTALNLAECHSRQGKTATAWAEFDRAIELGAKVKFQEAMVIARERRDELAQKLSRLTITVPDEVGKLPGLVVELNGAPLPKEQWNKAEIRDPGSFVVVARATGYVPLSLRVELGADKDAKNMDVVLDKEPPPVTPPPKAVPPPPPEPASLPIWPFVVGGAGVVMLGVSAGFLIDATNAGADLDEACGADRTGCPEGNRSDLESTRSREVTSFGAYVGLGAGGIVALGVAGLGLALALSGDGSSTDTAITAGPGSIGVRGSFQ